MATSDELSTVEIEIAIRRLRRRAQLEAASDYIGFAAMKLAGTGALLIGGCEAIVPDFLPLVLSQATSIAGIGLSMLIGKKAFHYLIEVAQRLKTADPKD